MNNFTMITRSIDLQDFSVFTSYKTIYSGNSIPAWVYDWRFQRQSTAPIWLVPWCWEPQRHLERIIQEELWSCERPYHNDPNWQSIPQTHESNIAINASNRLPSGLSRFSLRVELRHHDISGMRDHCACNTSDITSEEGNSSLLEPVVGRFGLAEVLVDLVDGGFEGCEFAHRVGDLAGPEGIETLVETWDC